MNTPPIKGTTSGNTHLGTADSLHTLADFYRKQGKYMKAEPLYQQALALHEQQVGADHPLVADNLHNLAFLYHKQRKYAQAEPLYLRALTIREQQLGADHPETAATLNNLGACYQDQKRYTQAEPLLLRAFALNEQQEKTWLVPTRNISKPAGAPFLLRIFAHAKRRARNLFRRFSHKSLDSLPYVPIITSIPNSPIVGKTAIISYHGWLAPDASHITMHWGYNNWNCITDTNMTRQNNGIWKTMIIVPLGATSLNMAFHNQNHVWDNNNASDYHLNILTDSRH